ncbi:crossover junction endonuclease EME1 [Rana temporaria]|uniref:crossover junction endonuclease EME1 n=1 Tax=Rana temporaria TaxID=8407 RepID=UPI001AAC4EAD|nr:crossover junction endonuclease EME1 [Rana temporaria]
MSSESSDSEDLPRLPFLASSSTAAARRPVAAQTISSSDSEQEVEELPLFRRLAAPPSRAAPAPRGHSARPPGSRGAKRGGGGGAPSSRAPPTKSAASRDPAGAPQSKKAKKCPESLEVHIDAGLLQDGSGGGQVLNALQAQEYKCVIQSQPVARSITWSRSGEDGNGEAFCQEEAEMLVLVPGEAFISMVQASKTEAHFTQSTGTLRGFVSHIMASKSRVIPSLVIMEMEKYFRDQKTKGKKTVRGEGAKERKRKQKDLQELPKLSRVDVEETLLVLQLQMNVHVWFLETWKEFSDFVCMFSKSLAEAPTKRQRDNTSFSFYMDGDWAGGVRVEKCGKGLLDVWKRQIQQFNRVGVEVASAVVAAYPSPQLLIKAYRHCQTNAERHGLLSDILVRRGEGVTSTSRRVGPELSKRIYLQFTSLQPELSLDL